MKVLHKQVSELVTSVFSKFPNIVDPAYMHYLTNCYLLNNPSNDALRIFENVFDHYNDIFGEITPETDALMNWCCDKYMLFYNGKNRFWNLNNGQDYEKKILNDDMYSSNERDLIRKLATIYNVCDTRYAINDFLDKYLKEPLLGDDSKIIMRPIKEMYVTRGLGLHQNLIIRLDLLYFGIDASMKERNDSIKNTIYRKMIIMIIRYLHRSIRNIFEKLGYSQLFEYIDIFYQIQYIYHENDGYGGTLNYIANSKYDYSDEIYFSIMHYSHLVTSPPPQSTMLIPSDGISLFNYGYDIDPSYYNWVIPVMMINCINDFSDRQKRVSQLLISSLLSKKLESYPKRRDSIDNFLIMAINSLKNPSIYSVNEYVKYTLGDLCTILSNNDCIEMINILHFEIPKFITIDSSLEDKINFFRHITENNVLLSGSFNEKNIIPVFHHNNIEFDQTTRLPNTQNRIVDPLIQIQIQIQTKIQKLNDYARNNNFDQELLNGLMNIISKTIINIDVNIDFNNDIFKRVELAYGSETIQYILSYVPVDSMNDICEIFMMS